MSSDQSSVPNLSSASRKKLYFTTSNAEKAEEAKIVLGPQGFDVIVLQTSIAEPLSTNLEDVVTAKAIEAYRKVRVPTYVEHGGLYIAALNNLPGCLSKVIFDALRGKICDMILSNEPREAIARSVIAYCDGKRIRLFEGKIPGEITLAPKGTRDYYYDSIFVPSGCKETFAEMTIEKKTAISHVKLAYEKFIEYLIIENNSSITW